MPSSETADRYYRPSGRVPFTGTLLMLVLGIAGVFLLAPVYAAADYHAQYDKLRMLAIMAYAGLTGGWVYLCARIGKIRSRFFAGLVGFVIGVAALHFAWVWFLCVLFGWDLQVLWMAPFSLWEAVKELGNAGIWTRDGRVIGPTEQFLWWGGEALAIILASTIIAAQQTRPFCEGCNSWTSKGVEHSFTPVLAPELKAELEQEEYSRLRDLIRKPGSPAASAVATVYSCPHCDEAHYLDIAVVLKEGENQSRTVVIDQLWIGPEVVDWLKNPGQFDESEAATQPVAVPPVEVPGNAESQA
ncbi:hypothetical protein [Planctomyces sp. SH-PL14]|uniref:hypothetical protein n=1 Tax=Planctomyces sp. SH-PL14 TaxID=1632864 RepID=UPI00078DF410|nr:hypothetical protein [Planctomyces sp. SH-PL14]AMV17712.1 hypothetical protein VT03_07450 [Planctomyces sp. SH-PL14]